MHTRLDIAKRAVLQPSFTCCSVRQEIWEQSGELA